MCAAPTQYAGTVAKGSRGSLRAGFDVLVCWDCQQFREDGVLEEGREDDVRGASEGQEGAFLICDGVKVLSGGTGALEGQGGDTGNR